MLSLKMAVKTGYCLDMKTSHTNKQTNKCRRDYGRPARVAILAARLAFRKRRQTEDRRNRFEQETRRRFNDLPQ
jgi:hypothetical protein